MPAIHDTDAGGPSPRAASHPYRWFALAGVWLLYYCFGLTSTAMAPLVGTITAELGLSHAAMGSVLGAWPLVYIAFAIPAGALVDRFGLGRALFAAAVVIALSGWARAHADGHLSLFLAVALFGLGGPLVSIGAPKLISQWFAGPDRGTAMGIYITGPALGGITALSLTNSVLMPWLDGQWRQVLLVYAGVTLLAGIVWLLVARHPARHLVSSPPPPPGLRGQLGVFATLVRVPGVRLVLAMSVGVFFFNHGLNNWLPEILRSGGMDARTAGYWASLPTVVGVAGSLVIPRLAVPSRRIAILLALFACAGVATLLIGQGAGPGLALGLVAQGVARSSMMTIAMLVLMELPEVGARHMGAAGGLFFSAAEIGGVLGPLGIGVVSDLSGGFDAALATLTGICGLLAVSAVALGRMQRRGAAVP
ncbi:MAG: MFS transporter [Chromatiales bacterium]|nr:MFS transporter [Chromatiales bacterium]